MNYDFYLDGDVYAGCDGYYSKVGTHSYNFSKSKKKLRQDEKGFFFRYIGKSKAPEFHSQKT